MKKKINKKGFTLVELLAVVVILLAISVVAVSSISAAIERNKKNKEDVAIEMIKSTAVLYVDDYENDFVDRTKTCVSVDTLISTYGLDAGVLQDTGGENRDAYVDVTYDEVKGKFEYEYKTTGTCS